MRTNLHAAAIVAAVATLAAVMSDVASAKLETGAQAPAIAGTGVDDKKHTLDDYADAKAIVVVFTCNHCPVAIAYEDRLIQLQKEYKDKGVQVLAVCVNDRDGDRLPGMKKRAKEKGFNFPYVYDATQQSARDYGATCTPHAFLLCKDRKIAYQGAIDDHNDAKKAEEHYLRSAVDAVLAGKTPPETATRQRGCSIKWKKKDR